MCIYLFIYLSIYLFIYLHLFIYVTISRRIITIVYATVL